MNPSVHTDASEYSSMLGGHLISPGKDALEYSFILGGHLIPSDTRAVKTVK